MTALRAPVIFTANRLADGEAVWLGANGCWLEAPDNALVATTKDERSALADAAAVGDADNHVVEPYDMPVVIEHGIAVPATTRERIRATGPTIRRDLGKQAAAALAA